MPAGAGAGFGERELSNPVISVRRCLLLLRPERHQTVRLVGGGRREGGRAVRIADLCPGASRNSFEARSLARTIVRYILHHAPIAFGRLNEATTSSFGGDLPPPLPDLLHNGSIHGRRMNSVAML